MEEAYFINTVFPHGNKSFGEQNCTYKAQFVDVNNSLSRILGWPTCFRDPWSEEIPALTSNSTILMRWLPKGQTTVCLRALKPSELFAIMGWANSMWAPSTPCSILNDTPLLRSLMGNTFNGFTFAPVLSVAVDVVGVTPAMFASGGGIVAADVAVPDVTDEDDSDTSS